MKLLSTLLLLFIAHSSIAQIKIVEKKVDVNGIENGFYITIPYGDKKVMSKELKDELKSWKGKITTKEYFFADDCRLKDMGKNTFDVYAKVEDITKGGVNISVKVTFGGSYLSSKSDPGNFQILEKKLYTFAVKAAKNVIEEEAKAEEKVLKTKEGELESIGKEITKNEQAIANAKKVIATSEEAITKGNENKAKKEEEIKETQAKIEAIRKKKEAVK